MKSSGFSPVAPLRPLGATELRTSQNTPDDAGSFVKALPPVYSRHVPPFVAAIHKHVTKAFHEVIDQLLDVIKEHKYEDVFEVCLLHKHTHISNGDSYVEYFHQNHFVQVPMSKNIMDSANILVSPYSFYFRSNRLYAFENTASNLRTLGYPSIENLFR